MKKYTISLALILCCAAALSAQTQRAIVVNDCKPLTIKFLGFRDPDGNRVKGSNLRDMLECVNDKKVTDRYKAGHALDWVGASLVTAGSILVLAAGRGYEYTDQQLKMGEWGLKTMGVGLGIQLGALQLKKSAVKLYNKQASGAMPTDGFSSASTGSNLPKEKHFGFAFGKTFYKRGIKPPEDLYVEGILFDNNSEIANSGFYISLFSEKKFSERFQGRTEFSWEQRGFGFSMRGSSDYYEASAKSRVLTGYMEGAWLAQFIANPSKPGIVLSAGPGLAFMTGIRIKTTATVKEIQTGKTESASDSAKGDLEDYSFSDRLDYGLHVGAGARWPIGSNQICFDVRYYLGLKNLLDDPYYSEKAYNRGWSFGLGYVLPF